MRNRYIPALVILCVLLPALLLRQYQQDHTGSVTDIEQAFADRISGVIVSDSGVVTTILGDDLKGSRHQRFIVEIDNSMLTLLIAHNIDIAPRIDSLKKGDTVRFRGEYVWNEQGGLLHWTHHDPKNRHPHGWIRHKGTIYQ